VDILSLDLARNMGWALGPAGKTPDSGSKELGSKGSNVGLWCGELSRWLRDLKRERGAPGLVIIERWIAPNRFMVRSDKSIEVALRLNGAVHAIMGGIYNVMIVEPTADTIRAAVCGRKSAGIGNTADERRAETKAMVCKTMKMLKLIPADAPDDDDRADAVCGWRWGEANYGRRAPAEFTLT
jgi:hypothetical protein